MKTPILVAVDAGSGNIAARFERDGQIYSKVTPARARQGNAQSMNLEAGTSWETEDDHGEISVFSVVSRGSDLINTCDPSYQISPAHRVMVINTLAQMGLGGCDVVLADTLPINQFYSDLGVINHDRIAAKRKSLMKPVKNFSGQLKAPRIVDVIVYPEAIPAYVSATILPDMTPNPAFEGAESVIVVDLGRFTCDIAELDSDHQIVNRGTSEHGIHMMLSRVHALIQENASKLGLAEPEEINLESIDSIIRQGYIGSRLESAKHKRIDIRELVKHAAVEHAALVRRDIREVHRNLSDVDIIVMVGGGANWIGGNLDYLPDLTEDWGCPVYIPDLPEFAIVRGVHLALLDDADSILADLQEEA
ncbi:ParM/StbA family protein [Yersinia ruckeri]|uniref:ParM/StbA family protein n=1 Tax=Yersinia ruckeri TaxID=29486 RepID=UPI0020BDC6AF|nr:ParM/StbA family protein [Yersinia ruckeri]EKN4689602.1 ParM/StbA family protein [Yersinia ruckeri]MCK8586376.1 ParM/StbA family protein [Yersinia ruckeri]MCW6615620.1 ParM/StbA family protein [Yersinia ruckeri]